MAFDVAVVVSLKIPDVVAHTAHTTLTRRMGYEALTGLKREDVYFFKIDADSHAAAEEFVHTLLAQTSAFVNPNKHLYQTIQGSLQPAEGKEKVAVLVEWLEDGTAELQTESLTHDPRFEGRVREVRRGTLWTLSFSAEAGDRAADMAQEIAVAEEAERGLLSNPHSQRATLLV